MNENTYSPKKVLARPLCWLNSKNKNVVQYFYNFHHKQVNHVQIDFSLY